MYNGLHGSKYGSRNDAGRVLTVSLADGRILYEKKFVGTQFSCMYRFSIHSQKELLAMRCVQFRSAGFTVLILDGETGNLVQQVTTTSSVVSSTVEYPSFNEFGLC